MYSSIVGKFEEEGWWINSLDDSEIDVSWILFVVEFSLFLASLYNLSVSETTEYKGEKGFPLVHVFL